MSSTSMLRLSDASVEYDVEGKKILALDKVSLDVSENGDVWGIVGESGSGKTTLGMCLLRLIESPGKITGGKLEYRNKEVFSMSAKELQRYRWREVSMVYQSAMNSLNPVKPVIQPITEVIRFHKGVSKSKATETALQLLSEVGIKSDRAFDFPHEMSGGMRQRVVIALAMALSPKLLIADEPTSALDVVIQKQILSLLRKQIRTRGLSLIFITHEISLLNGLVENVAVMFRGEIVEKGQLKKVLLDPKHPYTEMLVGTLLTLDSEFKGTGAIAKGETGIAADLNESKNMCKYVNRCKYAFQRCRSERPILQEVETGRFVACHKFN